MKIFLVFLMVLFSAAVQAQKFKATRVFSTLQDNSHRDTVEVSFTTDSVTVGPNRYKVQLKTNEGNQTVIYCEGQYVVRFDTVIIQPGTAARRSIVVQRITQVGRDVVVDREVFVEIK